MRDKDEIKLLSEENVKKILRYLNDIETYSKLFGDLEEG